MSPIAFAEEVETGVLTDFAGTDFDIDQYPFKEKDYSLEVIQIAESTHKELFVYVYQPFGDSLDGKVKLCASSMRISTNIDENAKWVDYSLSPDGSYKSIFKYKVDDFQVSSAAERYYDISSISRPWDQSIDDESGTDMTINEKAYRVGQLWTVTTSSNGQVDYSMRVTDVVELKDLYSSSIRYDVGHKFYGDTACDIFYVAFTADRPIDELKEADVDFTYYEYFFDTSLRPSDPRKMPNTDVHTVAYLKAKESTSYGVYSWEWIQSTEDFIKSEGQNMSSEAQNVVKGQQWVLLYFGSAVSITPYGPVLRPTGYIYKGYTTEKVSILRLKFEYDGVIYNLGVVSDKVSPASPMPVNPKDEDSLWRKFMHWVKKVMAWLFNIDPAIIPDWLAIGFLIFAAVALIVFVILITPFLPFIASGIWAALKAVGHGIVWLGKGLWWLITAPFRLIVHLFQGGG